MWVTLREGYIPLEGVMYVERGLRTLGWGYMRWGGCFIMRGVYRRGDYRGEVSRGVNCLGGLVG